MSDSFPSGRPVPISGTTTPQWPWAASAADRRPARPSPGADRTAGPPRREPPRRSPRRRPGRASRVLGSFTWISDAPPARAASASAAERTLTSSWVILPSRPSPRHGKNASGRGSRNGRGVRFVNVKPYSTGGWNQASSLRCSSPIGGEGLERPIRSAAGQQAFAKDAAVQTGGFRKVRRDVRPTPHAGRRCRARRE